MMETTKLQKKISVTFTNESFIDLAYEIKKSGENFYLQRNETIDSV